MNRKDPKMTKRILMSALGVLISGISIGMFKRAMLGVDPFQSLMSGLNAVIPISFGTLYLIANLLLLLFALITDRKKIGLATLINLLFLGYIAEYIQHLLEKIWVSPSFAGRLALLAVAVVILCFATAFYFTADLGVSPYDAVALVISERNRRLPFKAWRIITDSTCVIAGCCLCLLSGYTGGQIAGVIGIGTIITAFFMGPLISFFRVRVAEPFLLS
ncbi:MAG: hypothetical protein IJI24_05815 [Lachnospiraceae bacterium]|nr:hypothetical protein [Lachnospiraceae bacterium]